MVVLFEPSTNLPSINKPVLNDVDPLYFAVSHWCEKTWGMLSDSNRERCGYSERFKSGWINSFFYIAPRFLEPHVKQSQVPDLVSNLPVCFHSTDPLLNLNEQCSIKISTDRILEICSTSIRQKCRIPRQSELELKVFRKDRFENSTLRRINYTFVRKPQENGQRTTASGPLLCIC